MTFDEQAKQNSEKLIKYIKAHPGLSNKAVQYGLGWSQNKTSRYLKMNKDKLLNGWRLNDRQST